MRLLAGCADNGSLKEIVCVSGTDTSNLTAPQPLYVETSLSQGLNSAIEQIEVVSEKFLLLSRCSGLLELVKITRNKKEQLAEGAKATDESKVVTPEFEVSQFEVVHTLKDLTDDSRLEPLYSVSKKRSKLRDGFVSLQLFANTKHVYLAATRSGLIHIVQVDLLKREIHKLNTLEVKAPLEFAQLNDIKNDHLHDGEYIFAYGGEENLVKLVSIDAGFSKLTQIWEAKNVKNDRLDLRVPVWPVGLKFINPSPLKASDSKINFQFVVITRWSHLGLYRTQHGRKPLKYFDLLPNREPLTKLELIGANTTAMGNLAVDDFKKFSLITADTRHNVYKFCIDGHLDSKFGQNDMTGASTFLQLCKEKYLLQSSLDCYARVYDISTSRRLAKIYMGGRINCLMLFDEELGLTVDEKSKKKASEKRELEPELERQNADDLWDLLEEKGRKKRRT